MQFLMKPLWKPGLHWQASMVEVGLSPFKVNLTRANAFRALNTAKVLFPCVL